MNEPAPALAVCGSNLGGDVPFSVALRLADGTVHGQQAPVGVRTELPALVGALCARVGIDPAALRELRLDTGPGSYTGLRVAVTFVRFLQHFGPVRVLGVDSLALLAARARGASRVRPLLDARRERFHTALYASGPTGAPLVAVEPGAAVPFTEVLARLQPGDRCVLPAAVEALHGATLQARGAELVVARAIAADELFAADLPWFVADAAALEPRYLMGSYAEA